MPRVAKESDDEVEIKSGRRTRATGGPSILDSPLRRSTRNRQPVNQDVSSPESATNDAPARSTRRKTAPMESAISENIRSLRPRMNSTASDTAEIIDGEAQSDTKKRITRRSVVTSVETPTKSRLRRTTRAGSESKTMSPSVRTTRRTRASSVDLDESQETSKQNLLLTHTTTPIKTRARASAQPSEPAVAEESENLQSTTSEESMKPVMESDEIDSEDTNVSSKLSISQDDSIKSALNLNLSESDTDEKMNVEENSAETSSQILETSQDNVFENPAQLVLDKISSPKVVDAESKKQILFDVHEKSMLDLPKVILYKADSPLELSPGNKENEKSNIIILDKKLKFSSSNTIPSHRKSAIFMTTKKIDIDTKLRRSVDDQLLANTDKSPKTISSSSSIPSTSKPLNKSTTIVPSENDLVSATIGSRDESIIILGEMAIDSEHKETTYGDRNKETIINEPVMKIASHLDNDASEISSSSIIENEKQMDTSCNALFEDNESSSVTTANEAVEEKSSSLCKSITKDTPTFISLTELTGPISSQVEHSEVCSTSSARKSSTVAEIPDESIIEIVKDDANNTEDSKDDKRRSSLKNRRLVLKTPESKLMSNQAGNVEQTTKVKDDESEIEMENSFQDICADEWKNKDPRLSLEDESKILEKEVSQEKEEEYDLILVDKEAWQTAEKEGIVKSQETSDYDSDDTIIMQRRLLPSKSCEIHHVSTIAEEPMDVDEDDVYTEIEQENKITKSGTSSLAESRSRYSITKTLYENDEDNDKNEHVEKELGEDDINVSKRKSCPIKNCTEGNQAMESEALQDSVVTEPHTSMSRKSLDRTSLNSDKLSTLKKTSSNKIEKLDSSKTKESPEKSIFIDDTAMDIGEDENDVQEEMESSVKSSANRNQELLDISLCKKNTTPIQVSFDEETDEDNEKTPLDRASHHSNSSKKSQLGRNISTTVQINSDSDADRISSDSSDECNGSSILPSFLYNANTSSNSSSEEVSSSIDSDIAREYNFDGESNHEYSDDNVVGDECRASETENSDSEDDEDDMADFIDDDEEEDTDEEDFSEENINDEENDPQKEVIEEEVFIEEEMKTINSSGTQTKIKSPKKLLFGTNNEEEEKPRKKEIENDKQNALRESTSFIHSINSTMTPNTSRNVSIQIEESKSKDTDKSRKRLSKKHGDVTLIESSTPNVQNLVRNSIDVGTPKVSSAKKLKNANTSVLNESESEKRSKSASTWKPETCTKTESSGQLLNSPPQIYHEESTMMNEEKTNLSRSKSSKTSPFNKTMLTPQTNSPDTKSLMKEKLNDSLPALKLQQRDSLRASRRSVLENVGECGKESHEDTLEETVIKKICSPNEMQKKKKNKKMTTTAAENIDETTKIEELQILFEIENEQVVRKKKKTKKNTENIEISTTKLSEADDQPKKNKKKQKTTVVEEVTINTTQTRKPKKAVIEKREVTDTKTKKKRVQTTAESEPEALSVASLKKSRTPAIKSPEYKNNNVETSNAAKKTKFNDQQTKLALKKAKKPGANSGIAVSSTKQNIKRLPEDILENLSDVPIRPKKRRKLDPKTLPSKTMFDFEHEKPDNLMIEEAGYVSLSSSGGTTEFNVINLKKSSSKRSKNSTAALTFRERILARNPRQPVSAYLMYQQKLKASGKDKH